MADSPGARVAGVLPAGREAPAHRARAGGLRLHLAAAGDPVTGVEPVYIFPYSNSLSQMNRGASD
jgi:hypothetical protein